MIPGIRLATMVFPAPGGPIIRRLWNPLTEISTALLKDSCPRISLKSSSCPSCSVSCLIQGCLYFPGAFRKNDQLF